MQGTLIVITGPTGVGKTAAAIEVAERLGCEIVNADSRQIYRDIPIGTAAPTAAEQARVRHHLVEFKDLDETYSASQFETDALALLPKLWKSSDYAVMCGGSMMYIDAVCRGIDAMPDISPEVRNAVRHQWETEGIEGLLAELAERDPQYFTQVDRRNPRRVLHAVEVCREAGVPYSTLRTGIVRQRDFRIIKIALNLPREELFDRINRRVIAMIEQGLEAEARRVYDKRHFNSLNTVGFKEMFTYFDGAMDFDTAVARVQKNTRVYAKKQLTWLARDTELTWCRTEDTWQTISGIIR